MLKVLNFRVLIEQDEDGWFVTDVPAIPGCHTQGKTYEEAVERAKEVIELCLEVAQKDPMYKARIDLSEARSSDRFLGVTDVAVRATL